MQENLTLTLALALSGGASMVVVLRAVSRLLRHDAKPPEPELDWQAEETEHLASSR